MPKVQEPDVMGWDLTRKVRAQPATTMQKQFMSLMSGIIAGSFVMMCLQAVGVAQPDLPFSHILVSTIGLTGGYLFGNNAKTSMSGD